MIRWCTFIGALLASNAWAGSASAFRTGADLPELRTGHGAPVNWSFAPVTYAISTDLPAGISAVEMGRLAAQAAAAWAEPACSSLSFISLGSTAAPAGPGDRVNTIQWLRSGWAERGFPPDSPGATDVLYEKDASGVWHIIEAGADPVSRTPDGASTLRESGRWQRRARSTAKSSRATRFE